MDDTHGNTTPSQRPVRPDSSVITNPVDSIKDIIPADTVPSEVPKEPIVDETPKDETPEDAAPQELTGMNFNKSDWHYDDKDDGGTAQ